VAVENRGGANGGPQYNPMNIDVSGARGQNPKKPELRYTGMGYRTTGEVNKQAQAAPIKRPQPRMSGNISTGMRGAPVTPLTAETELPEQSVLEGTAMMNPEAVSLPMNTVNPDFQTINQYLPAMEWWASLPGTPQTTKDYVRYLRTVI